MSEILEDGKGRGYKASVSSVNRLNVSAKSNSRIYYNSREDGSAFSFCSSYSASSGDQVIYFKNTSSTKNFIITGIWVSSDNSGLWDAQKVTGTASGTAITGRILNFTKSTVADATAFGNNAVSGLSVEYIFASARNFAGSTLPLDFKEAIILGQSDAIAVKYTGTAGNVSAIIGGHYEIHGSGVN